MASRIRAARQRPVREIRYPFQLVVMCDGLMDEAVRTIAEENGRSIAETLRDLIGSGLDKARPDWNLAPVMDIRTRAAADPPAH